MQMSSAATLTCLTRVLLISTGQLRAFFVADTGLSCCAISEADGCTVLIAGADNGAKQLLLLLHNCWRSWHILYYCGSTKQRSRWSC